MSYDYNNGDGLDALDVTEPNGATEPVSNLDDAIRQIKKYLKDPVAGPEAQAEALNTNVATIATASATQSFAAGSGPFTPNFDNVDLDPGNDYNESTKIFVAPQDGRYLVICQLTVDKSATSTPDGIQHQLDILVDGISGARVRERRGDDDSEQSLQITRIFDLSEGQSLKPQYDVTVTSGSVTFDLMADPRESIFQVELIKRN